MTSLPRYSVSVSAGNQPGKPYAVVDRHDTATGQMRRVSFHRTAKQAQTVAKRLNAGAEALPTVGEWHEQR